MKADGAYARTLLSGLGMESPAASVRGNEVHPAVSWTRSGAMALTGRADGPPVMCPVPLAACADGVMAALREIAPGNALDGWSGAPLLTERARLTGLTRSGNTSPGGACRILPTADGWLALNMARASDWSLLPAWLEETGVDDWTSTAARVARRDTQELVARGWLMGLAVCSVSPPRTTPVPWFAETARGEPSDRAGHLPRVVDLSSLWAGPLCTRLLHALGADVVKVESKQRPDGARGGSPAFFRRMNAGKRSCVIDWQSRSGMAQLRELIGGADIVIEASRPRALQQRGLDPERLVQQRKGLTWISITGYGRQEPECQRVAFGDDAGVAAGLASLMHTTCGEPLFCADAIADPLTGMHAALAAWAGHCSGGGRLYSLPMVDVVTHCIQHDLPRTSAALRRRQQDWTHIAMHTEEAA